MTGHVIHRNTEIAADQETRLGHDRVRTSYSIQPSAHGNDRTKLLLTASIGISGRMPGGELMWNTWGNLGFERTRRMLVHDLEDIRDEAETRMVERLGAPS